MGHTVSGTVTPGLSGVYINTKTYSESEWRDPENEESDD